MEEDNKFCLERSKLPWPVAAPWAVGASGRGLPSLKAFCLGCVARNLDLVESLDGLPAELLEAVVCAARWRRLLDDELLPAILGSGITTLDLSNSAGITDASLFLLDRCSDSLQHLSVRRCPHVSLVGLAYALRSCSVLSYLDVSECRSISAHGLLSTLPVRRPPDAWEDEEHETAGAGPGLRTLIWRDGPAVMLTQLSGPPYFLEVNPPAWRTCPFEQTVRHCEASALPSFLYTYLEETDPTASGSGAAGGQCGGGQLLDVHPAERLLQAFDELPTVRPRDSGTSSGNGSGGSGLRPGAHYIRFDENVHALRR